MSKTSPACEVGLWGGAVTDEGTRRAAGGGGGGGVRHPANLQPSQNKGPHGVPVAVAVECRGDG